MTTSPRPNWSLALGLPLLVMLVCSLIVYSPFFASHSTRLSAAVTLDLTVTAPLLYFLAIRRSVVSKMTVIRVFVVGVLVAGFLPGGWSPLLHGIKTWISPVVEAVVVITVIWNIRKARRRVGAGEMDMLTHLRSIAAKVFGNERVGDVLGSELAVFYYVLAGRRRKALTATEKTLAGKGSILAGPERTLARSEKSGPKDMQFSYVRASGAVPVVGVFLMGMLAEGVGLHFLIVRWSPLAAWILTGLSAYTMLQLYAHIRAMKARPIQVKDEMLYLRNGLAADVCVRIEDVEEMILTRGRSLLPVGGARTAAGEMEKPLKLALFGAMEGHTVCVRLRQPVTVVRMFGIRRRASVLLFAVDKPEELLDVMREAFPRVRNVLQPPSP